MTLMHGMRGDAILVNGAPQPRAAVPRALVRVRLVNGANARQFRLSFSDRRRFWWIATDNGLLVAPVERQSVDLAPGERAEIVVDFSTAGPVDLMTAADPNLGMMMRMMGRAAGGGAARVMRFEPQPERPGRVKSIPPRLIEAEAPDAARAVRRRKLVLTMGMPGMGRMGGMMGGMMGRGGGGGPGAGRAVHGIDGRAFDIDRIDQQVRLGDTEIWDVSGEMMAHPFHVHGVRFQVLRRNGRAAGSENQGWRDTVMVGDPVEFLVTFTQPARDAPFMYHCHILEHEDNGMMGQFTVT
jgi:FtsP/CotA-like multicopper oxidase with cupredoxin domain